MTGALLSLALLLGTPTHAERAPARPAVPAPVRVTCDDMVVRNREQTARCEGHVKATRLAMTLTCDRSLAHYDPDGHIIDLTCLGNVRVVEKDRVATSDQGVYREVSRTVELTGHAVVKQRDDVLTGEPILFYVDEDRVVAKGAKLKGIASDLKASPHAANDGGEVLR